MLSIDAWLDEKPYKELYDGAVHEKVGPQRAHALVSRAIIVLLDAWGGGFGEVGPEWRVYLSEGTTLVPDVAFFSDVRLSTLSELEREKPPFAPDIVVEVRSPQDCENCIERKTALYLAHGAILVLNVDPQTRTVRISSQDGEQVLQAGETIEDGAFPDLHIAVNEIFAPLDRRGA
ncbi:MAG: Uma2 family endonuclease [Candidatus Eremiobacteraeota bacterium]|nr:Uma2 family endonuclease [Candidatus Eremiobacteraeota bacterium]